MLYGLRNIEALLQLVKKQMFWEEQILLVHIVKCNNLTLPAYFHSPQEFGLEVFPPEWMRGVHCLFADSFINQWLTRKFASALYND